ncbi:MAG TPA: PspC domain-containing protein [Acidimicrobiales bacterium]|nr:PspC domain-containing protein [Acidimicrobiales bacterium]
MRGRGPLRRSQHDRLIAGVAGGVAARLGVDATLVRIVVVLFGLASGIGVVGYVVAWLLVPTAGQTCSIASRAKSDRVGVAVAIAFVPLLALTVVVAAALGVGFVSSVAWMFYVSLAGLVLIYRNADPEESAWMRQATGTLLQVSTEPRRPWRMLVLRIVAGLVLLAAGLFLLVEGHPSIALLRPAAGTLLVIAAFVVVFGRWWLGLARQLVQERQARVRAEERADMAARVHDSVLQTLALIQKGSGNPQRVVQLARAQERELRSWLFDGRRPGSFGEEEASTLAAGVLLIEHEVETTHGIAVEAVTVGDCGLTDELRALLGAGKEAAVNAAKWSGAPVVSLFAEVEPHTVTLFVRDRGQGFDATEIPADRRGIAESIQARMTRAGGAATVRSTPGAGTEVELTMPRPAREAREAGPRTEPAREAGPKTEPAREAGAETPQNGRR